MPDLYLDRAENEIARLYADNIELRVKVDRLQAQLDLSARAWNTWESTLRARDMEIAELRAEIENERLKEQNYLTVLNANQIEMARLRAEAKP